MPQVSRRTATDCRLACAIRIQNSQGRDAYIPKIITYYFISY